MAAPAPAPPLSMEKVRAAHTLLRDIVPESRLVASEKLAKHSGGSVHLKLECEGPTGSFKVRGAYCAIHSRKMPFGGELPGVITASTGNHGAAVAYAASKLGIPARIYLPENPNPAKRARIAQLGAEIVEVATYLEETRRHAQKFAETAEPAGAATTAAFLKIAASYADKSVVLVVTGSNVPDHVLRRALSLRK